jgi:RND superfamily putative drug exporter
VRTVLVPALMHLCGRANWWLPGWLDRRLPHLAVDVPDAAPASAVARDRQIHANCVPTSSRSGLGANPPD